eukprot:403345049
MKAQKTEHLCSHHTRFPLIILGFLILHFSYMTYRTIRIEKDLSTMDIIMSEVQLLLPIVIGAYWCKLSLRLQSLSSHYQEQSSPNSRMEYQNNLLNSPINSFQQQTIQLTKSQLYLHRFFKLLDLVTLMLNFSGLFLKLTYSKLIESDKQQMTVTEYLSIKDNIFEIVFYLPSFIICFAFLYLCTKIDNKIELLVPIETISLKAESPSKQYLCDSSERKYTPKSKKQQQQQQKSYVMDLSQYLNVQSDAETQI